MLANNVQESTTSTGTGNITLAGSSEDGRTFSSQMALNTSFDYVIDDGSGNFEIGTGYLSNSTTLVRAFVSDSSNSNNLVNFGTGTKQVYIAPTRDNSYSSARGFSSLGSNAASFMMPSNYITMSSGSLSTNRVHYCPVFISAPIRFNLIGMKITSTGTTNILAGIYSVNKSNGRPDRLIVAGQISTSSATLAAGSVTETQLQAGWYYAAVWCANSVSVRVSSGTFKLSSPFTARSGSAAQLPAFLFKNESGLTALPTVADPNDSTFNFADPIVYFGVS